MSDPFGTEALRESVLRAWADSPTRLTEDTNAERDLRVGAYRDRLLVELAQNAADAAQAAGAPGTLRVSVVDGELRVANTGAPLDAAGVAALASLRASAKQGMVGRFGVGFAAVLAVSSEPRVLSRTGGVMFSETRTRQAVGHADEVPVLRLPWPHDSRTARSDATQERREGGPDGCGTPHEYWAVPDGFDTEVRLPLRDDIDPDELLTRLAAEVEDLLLSLTWLARITVGDATWTRSEVDGRVEIAGPAGVVRWLLQEAPGGLWAMPSEPLETDVLHAPTPTDERLSLPARLIASIPLEPSRRRVLPGADVTRPATAYPALVRKLAPADRLALVPKAGFPLSEVDGQLREAVLRELGAQPWLPTAGADIPALGARVLSVDSPRLAELIGDVVPRLVTVSGHDPARVLATVGAERLDVPELIDTLTGIDRSPVWWRDLYDVLLPLLEAHSVSADDLGALPVPLADGRTLPGPRGALLFDGDLLESLAEADIVGLRLAHPDAAHPLLERLGAKRAEPADLLDAPALREAVERSVEDAESGLDTRPLAEAVLRLVSDATAADLGALALPAEDGWRRADELVLPTSPLLAVFDPEALGNDGPLSVLDKDFAEQWPVPALRAVGVLDGFVVTEDGIRDLDLVADDAWPQALRLIAGERETWEALKADPGWIARNALLGGRSPEEWRLPEARGLAGLYDPVPDVGVRPDVLAAAGVRAALEVADLDAAADLLDRLGDPDRQVAPGLVARAHAALADAGLDWSALNAPERVRTVDGSVTVAERAAVLDRPWLAAVWPADRLVTAAGDARAERLAELLDLPLLSETIDATLPDDGEFVPWSELTAICLVAELLDIPLPDGGVVVHEQLSVEIDGVKRDAPWWVESGPFHGEHHAGDTPAGLARAFAHAAGCWPQRHLVEALLDDPDPLTLFS